MAKKHAFRISYTLRNFGVVRIFEVKAKDEEDAMCKWKAMLGGVAKRCEAQKVEKLD